MFISPHWHSQCRLMLFLLQAQPQLFRWLQQPRTKNTSSLVQLSGGRALSRRASKIAAASGFHSHCCIDCRIGLSDTPQGHTDNCLANDGRRRACSTSRRSTRLTLKSSKEHGKASLVQNHPRTPKGADEELLGRSFMFTHPLERASCRPSVRLSSSLCAGRRDEHVLGALYASGTAQGACKVHLSR